MVNRQIVSAPEREALSAESNFWKSIEMHLLRLDGAATRVFQTETGPIPLHRPILDQGYPGLRHLYVDSLEPFRKAQGCGHLHWITGWNVMPENPDESPKLYILMATAQPIQQNLDQMMIQVITGSRSMDDAIHRLSEFRNEQAARESDWDVTFHNQSFGLPSPWTWLSGFWVNNSQGFDVESSKLLELSVASAKLYENLCPPLPADYITTIAHNDHASHRESTAQRLIFAHTARSMWLRTIPRQIGVRHQTTNDAPSHNSIRVLLLIRIKELYPDVYALARQFLPPTTQHRIQNAVVKRVVNANTGQPVETFANPPPRRLLPDKPKIIIPDSMTNWIDKLSDFQDDGLGE